jgi:hypothetical protein
LLLNYLHQPADTPTKRATPFSSANGPRRHITPLTKSRTSSGSVQFRCAPSTLRAT